MQESKSKCANTFGNILVVKASHTAKFNIKRAGKGTSLAVQWLRLCPSNTGGASWILGLGTKILHAALLKKKPQKTKKGWEVDSCYWVE